VRPGTPTTSSAVAAPPPLRRRRISLPRDTDSPARLAAPGLPHAVALADTSPGLPAARGRLGAGDGLEEADELGLETPPPHTPRPCRRLWAGAWQRGGKEIGMERKIATADLASFRITFKFILCVMINKKPWVRENDFYSH
jgi:hypothetical protein